jgi:hypothetical protein
MARLRTLSAVVAALALGGVASLAHAEEAVDHCLGLAKALDMTKGQVGGGQIGWRHSGDAVFKYLLGGASSYQIQFRGKVDPDSRRAGTMTCKSGKLDCIATGPGDMTFSVGGRLLIVPSKDTNGSVPLDTGGSIHIWNKGMDLFCAPEASPATVPAQ